MIKILIFLFCLTPIISFSQIELKTLVNNKDFIVKYYQDENYLGILIESKYTPFIYSDINRNNLTDPYIDRLYSVNNGVSLCVANQLEKGNTTTCGQSTKATLIVNQNNYHFIIPKNELTYLPTSPIYLSFETFDKKTLTRYTFNSNEKSYIINP